MKLVLNLTTSSEKKKKNSCAGFSEETRNLGK